MFVKTRPSFQLVSSPLIVLKLDLSSQKGPPTTTWSIEKTVEVLVFTCEVWNSAASTAVEAGPVSFPSPSSSLAVCRTKLKLQPLLGAFVHPSPV